MNESDYLAAIDADPDSDAPRLAHAEWLQTRDPARAEFIRAQVARARSPWGRDRHGGRACQLLGENETRWRGALPSGAGCYWRIERSYPDHPVFHRLTAFEKLGRQLLAHRAH